MKNQLGDKCFADTLKVFVNEGFMENDETKNKDIVLWAEVDGLEFDSGDYKSKKEWLQAIVERVYNCAMGKLNFNDPKNNERD